MIHNCLSEMEWQRLLPLVRERFPRITAADLDDCSRRVDLLIAKVQNRHWIDVVSARRAVVETAREALGVSA